MKLLFDQNLSYKLVTLLAQEFQNSAHVFKFSLHEVDDLDVWKFAKANQYTIVTKDVDFYDISLLHHHPPKILWLRIGNLPTIEIAEIIRKNRDSIIDFGTKDIACLEIYRP